MRLANDYGDGPAEDVPAGWQSCAAAPSARNWGSEEEELVLRATGCDDGGVAAAALTECAGNTVKARD